MENKFFNERIDESSFKFFLKDINKCKVGFYSIGLYPASLAYNCAIHSDNKNLLLAPRPGRNLLGAFSDEVISQMNPEIIKKISEMGITTDENSIQIQNNLSNLILKCDIVILSSNSNHIKNDIALAIKLKKDLKRENVVLTCLVGSFCVDDKDNKPFILCEKYPDLAFFTGFHRHGALRNKEDSFSANFCHPDSLTAFIGTKILNQLSPNIQVSAGVHNLECQYIKAIKNVSSIFSGFVNTYHSKKPGLLPTINTVLLSQCFDQAASISYITRKVNKVNEKYISLKELGYGTDLIKAYEIKKDNFIETKDYTFSQLNAVTADVLGSMSLPTKGKPTRNFQAGQVLSEMLLKLKRCPNDISEFIEWCDKYDLSQGDLEGLKSLKFWPHIYKKYKIYNNNSSMINLIHLCFYSSYDEKKDIYNVLTKEEQIINYCQESVKSYSSFEMSNKLIGKDIFDNLDDLYTKIFSKSFAKNSQSNQSKKISHSKDEYLKVINIVNKYFQNESEK